MEQSGGPVCSICGKPLSDPASIMVGIGPVCRANLKWKQYQEGDKTLFGDDCIFDSGITDGVMWIWDQTWGKPVPSVTNAAESVVPRVIKEHGAGIPSMIICRDSYGIWDALIVNPDGTFAGFKSIGTTSKSDAVRWARDNGHTVGRGNNKQ